MITLKKSLPTTFISEKAPVKFAADYLLLQALPEYLSLYPENLDKKPPELFAFESKRFFKDLPTLSFKSIDNLSPSTANSFDL